jgi:hypothetical protein
VSLLGGVLVFVLAILLAICAIVWVLYGPPWA